ncbi:MAG: hypothetical protein QXU18_03085 [Thermoplasmatales archaeon]
MFEFGHAKDYGDLPKINLSLAMQRRRSLPLLFDTNPGIIVGLSTLAITLDSIKNLVPAVAIIRDCSFFSLDDLVPLGDHGNMIVEICSLKEVKQVFTANMRRLNLSHNTIVCNDKPRFAKHLSFSLAILPLRETYTLTCIKCTMY